MDISGLIQNFLIRRYFWLIRNRSLSSIKAMHSEHFGYFRTCKFRNTRWRGLLFQITTESGYIRYFRKREFSNQKIYLAIQKIEWYTHIRIISVISGIKISKHEVAGSSVSEKTKRGYIRYFRNWLISVQGQLFRTLY